MEKEKPYYARLDWIRVMACVLVLLYHLQIVKGGFLAVCTFFVMTGYLSCISAFHKEKMELKKYYGTRWKHLYLPLAIVVYLSVIVFSFFPHVGWMQLKPESISALLGINNFWQLSANSNYFTKQMNSPLIHFWYLSILLQFDLIFPLLFIGLKKLGEKTRPWIPGAITFTASIAFTVYFAVASQTQDRMMVYYHTFARIFSILWGCFIAILQHHHKKLVFPKANTFFFAMYFILLIALFIVVDASTPYFALIMIGVTLLSCRLIDYATVTTHSLSTLDKIMQKLGRISYEIFLVQCPIIYFFQNLSMGEMQKKFGIVLATLLLAYVIHQLMQTKGKVMGYVTKVILLSILLCGNYYLITAQDNTQELKELEEQMAQNRQWIETKNTEYASKVQKEQEEWETYLRDFEMNEEKMKAVLRELPIVGIGDSVMLGAVPNLYEVFPNGYFDAKVSRSIYGVNSIVENLKANQTLGNPVIMNLGANGEGTKKARDQVMSTIGEDKTVFWITVTNDQNVHVNDNIKAYPQQYANVQVIDWEATANGHKEYFYTDGLHLTPAGRKAYTETIYQAVYQYYWNQYQAEKEKMIQQHEAEQKTKITFYGNDILVNCFALLQDEYEKATFHIQQEASIEQLKEEIQMQMDANALEHNVVLLFDTTAHFTKEDYETVISLCEGHEIYVLCLEPTAYTFSQENVHVIPFYEELVTNETYYRKDRVHLSDEGNLAFIEAVRNAMNEE